MIVLLSVFAAAAVVLSLSFRAAEWRAANVLIPRYCDAPERHLALIRRLLTEEQPVDHAERRPPMIAAKLLFVVPRARDEAVEDYVDRLRRRIRETCR